MLCCDRLGRSSVKHQDVFPLKQIDWRVQRKPKSITFGQDEIEKSLHTTIGSRLHVFDASSLVTLPWTSKMISYRPCVYARSSFQKRDSKNEGSRTTAINFFKTEFDYLANLNCSRGTQNLRIQDLFTDWSFKITIIHQLSRLLAKHYQPEVDLRLENFEEFISDADNYGKERNYSSSSNVNSDNYRSWDLRSAEHLRVANKWEPKSVTNNEDSEPSIPALPHSSRGGFPPKERWDDWTELDSQAWPRP